MEAVSKLDVVNRSMDMELVCQARGGFRPAFDELFQRHKTFIYNVCYRMLGSADDAVDATQSAFIQAYSELHRFRGDAEFRSWLYRIAVNICVNHVRRESRSRKLNSEIARPPDPDSTRDMVWEALLELPPDLRAVLVLFYFQGLESKELADALGCSDGAARTRLYRARQVFKKKYEELVP